MLIYQILIERNADGSSVVTIREYAEDGSLRSTTQAGELAGKQISDAVESASTITAAEKVAAQGE